MSAQEKTGAFAYGSLGDLVPWPDDEHFPNIPADEALELFLGWVEARGMQLWDHQEEALLDLAAGTHVILGTPTGSGKSMVALGMCFLAMCTDRRSYYTAPIKALVSEKFFELCDVLGRDNVGMITGDTVINAEAPVICCTAEILANDALRWGEKADIGCVAMDEFHFYGDRDRGWAWQVPLLTLPHVQFLLMSATLGDMDAIAAMLERQTARPVERVLDAPRPVPLTFEFVDTPLETTVELAVRNGAAPIYAVHFAQDDALGSAQALANYGISTKEQREALKDAVAGTSFSTAFGKTLKRLLLAGVGVHHAGMLPRYRLLVEKLAQQGLLPVICGTDTLGVGINVPIHTVLMTALAKYDGHRQRRLNAREFHQIAGRAGRAGFDTEGLVIAQATEYDIENAKALAKAGGDAKAARKIKTKKPPEGFVGWNKQNFEKLVSATPEALKPHMKVTHSMVLAECEQGGRAMERVRKIIEDSDQTPAEKAALLARADEVLATLMQTGVVELVEGTEDECRLTIALPEDFALDQPLSPFLLAALELLDPEDPDYALNVISMAEATLEDPYQILRRLERLARDEANAQMKAEGIEYEERMERLQDVTYARPLEDVLEPAFEQYCAEVPWARDFELRPKSILRDMIETASDFRGYVTRAGIPRSEGLLLRYLSDAYRVLDHTIPPEKVDDRLADIISWLRVVVRTVDSSLIDEWAGTGQGGIGEQLAAPGAKDEVVHDRRGITLLVRNALWRRVRLISFDNARELGELDAEWGWREARWQQMLDAFYEAHEDVIVDDTARRWEYLAIDEADELTDHVWHVRQTLCDTDEDHDFLIAADVDLDATQETGEVVFTNYRAGVFEDL